MAQRTFEFTILHTAGSYDWERKRVVHQSFETVKRYHMMPKAQYDEAGKLVPGTGGLALKDIGYERYVTRDGRLNIGRLDHVGGAHTKGLNFRSRAICVSGHGDFEMWNAAQLRAVVAQCATWCRLDGVPLEHIIGHRDAPRFGGEPTAKTCPGKLINLDMIRALVRDELAGVNRGIAPPGDDEPPPTTRRDGTPKPRA